MAFVPHCNICHAEIVVGNGLFTSCGHFFCHECYDTKRINRDGICCFCHQQCSILRMDQNIPEEVELFIESDPNELLLQAIEVYRFQDIHNRSHMDYLSTKVTEQQSFYESKISSLESEINRLKKSLSQTDNQPPPMKRPDFISHFKSSLSSQHPRFTPLRAKRDELNQPGTPSFIDRTLDKRPMNPFMRNGERQGVGTTPSRTNKGLEVPGSITRHPQLVKTPLRTNSNLPFNLLRPPQSAPVLHSNL